MQNENNWFRIATAAEQPAEGDQQAENAISGFSQPGIKPASEESSVSPKPTPTPVQKSEQGKQQQSQNAYIHQVALPDIANKALPTLNESLYNLTSSITAREDLNLTQDQSRLLAIEIIAAWLASSRQNMVSEMSSIVAGSARINSVVDSNA